FREQPSLDEVASKVHLSPFHFQKIFTDWAGISPKKFLQFLTVEELKKELQSSNNIADAAYSVGLSAQSRVYDLFVNIEAVTPQEYKTQGKGINIEYGFHETPFGTSFIAQTEKGICAMSFVDDNEDLVLNEFTSEWLNASIKKNQHSTGAIIEQIFEESPERKELKLLLKGTKFQLKVWEALLKIPFGSVSSYQNIATSIGQLGAIRAVGSAVGANPVAFIIPCHRVIRSQGMIGQYHWGTRRKTAMIGWERAKRVSNEL
ncbi:MAG: bifunctional helix-turn-helix domain-containing protein/methylated-DNA--[protein]-cysteine S-methyltransferase, partial [Flavisolibacter sp.]